MDSTTFRQQLAADGFDEVLERSVDPDFSNAMHEHPFDARLLVVAGDMTLATATGEVTYRAGDWCELLRGMPHREVHGSAGASLLIGRRR